MRRKKLALFVASVLAAVPLVVFNPSAGAAPPPPPLCVRTIDIDDPRVWEGTPGRTNEPTPLTFRLTTTGCLLRAVEVETRYIGQYQNHGDFVAVNQTLAWPSGNGDTKTFTVNVTKDSLPENNEGFYLGLCFDQNLVQVSSGGTGTILNDDIGPPAQESPIGGEQVCK